DPQDPARVERALDALGRVLLPEARAGHAEEAHGDHLARREGIDRVERAPLRRVGGAHPALDGPLGGLEDPEHGAQDRRLSRAVGSDDREEVAAVDLEVDAVDDRAAVVTQPRALERDQDLGLAHFCAASSRWFTIVSWNENQSLASCVASTSHGTSMIF